MLDGSVRHLEEVLAGLPLQSPVLRDGVLVEAAVSAHRNHSLPRLRKGTQTPRFARHLKLAETPLAAEVFRQKRSSCQAALFVPLLVRDREDMHSAVVRGHAHHGPVLAEVDAVNIGGVATPPQLRQSAAGLGAEDAYEGAFGRGRGQEGAGQGEGEGYNGGVVCGDGGP